MTAWRTGALAWAAAAVCTLAVAAPDAVSDAASAPVSPAGPTRGDAPLPDAVRLALAQAGVPLEAVSAGVWPAQGGGALLQHRATEVRQAASLMKLFTTGVALQRLGPAWTWSTDVGLGGPLGTDGRLGGSVYLRGQGDPALLPEHIDGMLARWMGAGLQTIEGDLVLDRQAFDVPPHDPAAFDGQALKPYNAGPDALIVAHGAVTLRLRPDVARPGLARVELSPPLDGVTLRADVVLGGGPCADWREALALAITPETAEPATAVMAAARWTVSLKGRYPAACGEREWPVLWPASDDLPARLIASRWRAAGGQVLGKVRTGAWPDGMPVWQSWRSQPLAEVVRDINKFSNNVMARQLFLTLGQGADGRARLPEARATVARAVQHATRSTATGDSPCEGDALVLDNGSGLSRWERTSAACLGRWLQALWRAPTMPEMLASLPVAGVDGTARRLRSVAGFAHLKTGSLDGVTGIAGVLDSEHGDRRVVVVIVNHPRAEAARPAFDALLAWARTATW